VVWITLACLLSAFANAAKTPTKLASELASITSSVSPQKVALPGAALSPADVAVNHEIAITANILALCPQSLAAAADIYAQLEYVNKLKDCIDSARTLLNGRPVSADLGLQLQAIQLQQKLSVLEAETEESSKQLGGEKDFIGVKWGVGVGVSYAFDDVIDDAQVIDGVVRVKKDLTYQPRVILEFHKYLWCHKKRTDGSPIETGCGPFAAVASRDDKVVSGVALGFMYGWKTGTGAESSGFSVGLGLMLDAAAQELGKGFKDGQPPPADQPTIFTKERSALSAILFATKTF
jgi:hypothetical protein